MKPYYKDQPLHMRKSLSLTLNMQMIWLCCTTARMARKLLISCASFPPRLVNVKKTENTTQLLYTEEGTLDVTVDSTVLKV